MQRSVGRHAQGPRRRRCGRRAGAGLDARSRRAAAHLVHSRPTQGEVRITAAAEGETVRFTVADTGIGIAPADQQRIFEDFEQVDGPIQRRVRGTGLGLPLTRKLAVLLGGSVALQSEPGVGSRFSLVVPRDIRPEEAARG
jgi:signal transduction histidine kinase